MGFDFPISGLFNSKSLDAIFIATAFHWFATQEPKCSTAIRDMKLPKKYPSKKGSLDGFFFHMLVTRRVPCFCVVDFYVHLCFLHNVPPFFEVFVLSVSGVIKICCLFTAYKTDEKKVEHSEDARVEVNFCNLSKDHQRSMWVFHENRGFSPKMDGENNGKPY